MPTQSITFRETGYFSPLMCDYLDRLEALDNYYNRFPSLENFPAQIEEKSDHFASVNRAVLENALLKQYKDVDASLETHNNIIALRKSNTFTITTGHQLNLFTGPLYFLYKIISTINLCKELQQRYPDYHFVPVYWMATEDHDFDEINCFNFKGKKVQWSRPDGGAVGRMDTVGLDVLFKAFANEMVDSNKARELKALFTDAYLSGLTLAAATRNLANALFGEYGLVIIDGDDPDLKRIFIPYAEKEILSNASYRAVNSTNEELSGLGYDIQVNPREINLFYMVNGLRERMVHSEGIYSVLNTKLKWDSRGIREELNKHPERFSPNVITRPLYQEVILPNLCYIGGGGELAYWLQLKRFFNDVKVAFPMLLLRNSALIIQSKHLKKIEKLGLETGHLFMRQHQLLEFVTRKESEIEIDMSQQKTFLKEQFKDLYKIAEKTDPSFNGAVAAQERKQLKGLEKLEKRLLKAQKRRLKDVLDRVRILQDELFPNGSLQERNKNFSEFYLEHGKELVHILKANLHPLELNFQVLEI